MQPAPYLFFNGNCAEALQSYARILGGEITAMMPASEMPEDFPVPEDRRDWIMHASLRLGSGLLMASDNIEGTSDSMAGCSVHVGLPDANAARAAFDALAAGGKVTMAFEPTFWSAGFGTLTDRFGVRWMIDVDDGAAA